MYIKTLINKASKRMEIKSCANKVICAASTQSDFNSFKTLF